MSRESAGSIEFCQNCKRLIDYALTTDHQHHLYIQINKEVPSPENRVVIPVCDVCHNMLTENLSGIDGFIVSHEIPPE